MKLEHPILSAKAFPSSVLTFLSESKSVLFPIKILNCSSSFELLSSTCFTQSVILSKELFRFTAYTKITTSVDMIVESDYQNDVFTTNLLDENNKTSTKDYTENLKKKKN